MKLSSSSLKQIEQTIRKAIGRFPSTGEANIVTDIHIQPHQSSGELTIYNDDDKLLAEAIIEEWMTYIDDNFIDEVALVLSSTLEKMNKAGEFDHLSIMKPYSFVLIDEEKETVSELLLMDDDTLMISDELLKGLDEVLDSFLKDLLEK